MGIANSSRRSAHHQPRRGRIVAIIEGDLDGYFDGAPDACSRAGQQLGSTSLMRLGVVGAQRVPTPRPH